MIIDSYVKEAVLYEKLADNAVRCNACAHQCCIKDGMRGICQVRINKQGTLFAPWGYVNSLAVDPVEKKPFYQVLPGSGCLTFGMLGCDFHCDFCQNWQISQLKENPSAEMFIQAMSPDEIVSAALLKNAPLIASSYNEPLITLEWAVDIFNLAKLKGLKCLVVSNGNMTKTALDYVSPYLSGYKIDLKTMRDSAYRTLGGKLQSILDGIKMVWEKGVWIEIVTLIVPGFNDSVDELRDAAKFIAEVSCDIPWHVAAFYPNYKRRSVLPTSADMVLRACEIGKSEGLNYVYGGNLHHYGDWENTHCPSCGILLIERMGFSVVSNRIQQGACPQCGKVIAGIWP